ncbi:MAG: HAD family hydrolase [Rectinemataceae bacterium]|nr:HAD family hydrolase [Rectinemataceae bacterium]
MIVRRLPDSFSGLIFDMDGTLYTHKGYFDWQESSQVARLASHLGIPEDEAAVMMAKEREARRAAGLPKTSMANLFLELGRSRGFPIDMDTIIRWRQEEIRPAEWLKADQKLGEVLAELASRFRLCLLTNNPRSVGKASLVALDIAPHFSAVVGLDDNQASKPSPQPFLKACAALDLPPASCVSIGDRMDVDIEPALALGMGGILVEGVEDVYRLPELLKC